MTWSPAAVARLVAIGVVGGILQLTTVSQVAVFGVPADLSPLLAGAVGLLCGSIAGASFGFGLGLFMDTLLAQTLGVTSLVLLGVGYAAGRLRELRDPAHALIPVAVGAAATAAAAIGFTVLQLLLGVDAPVSLMLLRQILLVDRAQHAARDAGVHGLPPRARPVPARRSASPPPARLHHGRAEPAEPRVGDAVTDRGSPTADHAAARGARRRARRRGVRRVRDHLLPALVPAGADRRRLRQPGAREPRAQGQDRGAARQHHRSQRQGAGQDARRARRADPAEHDPGRRAPGRRHLPQGARRLRGAPPRRRAGPARARAPAARRRPQVDARRAPDAPQARPALRARGPRADRRDPCGCARAARRSTGGWGR